MSHSLRIQQDGSIIVMTGRAERTSSSIMHQTPKLPRVPSASGRGRTTFASTSPATATTTKTSPSTTRHGHEPDIEEGLPRSRRSKTQPCMEEQKPSNFMVDIPSGHLQVDRAVLFDDDALSLQQQEDYFSLREDIYSLIILSPVLSPSFFFAIYIYAMKMTFFTFLALGLGSVPSNPALWTSDVLIRATQFFLIPVAIAMQEDLISVYQQIANVRYDKDVERISPPARYWKWLLSAALRMSDGLYSLAINFQVLMTTDQILSIFLNFAALQFLQSIDDVAFKLADQGFLGDRMEDKCVVVRRVRFPRLVDKGIVNSLDSILYVLTCLFLLAVYAYVVAVSDVRLAEL